MRITREGLGRLWCIRVFCILALFPGGAGAEVVRSLPTDEPLVALTLDACETRKPSRLDSSILDYLTKERIPFTIFASGRFAERNREQLQGLSSLHGVEIENHSLSHRQHMERLSDEAVRREILGAEEIIRGITGVRPRFFRFPAGNYDGRTLRLVESLGYSVVHWTFASGDPVKKSSAARLTKWVLSQVRPGSILIFHVNGRGYHTGEALPSIVRGIREKGMRFVKLEDVIRPADQAGN
jgi:peptidoglycan/xylan/chitin deacetylase (PgdA/CDA1 family)